MLLWPTVLRDYNCLLYLSAALKSGHIRSLSLDLNGFIMGTARERGRIKLGGNIVLPLRDL